MTGVAGRRRSAVGEESDVMGKQMATCPLNDRIGGCEILQRLAQERATPPWTRSKTDWKEHACFELVR